MEEIKSQYDTYVDLFKHYSSMIFRARISIITTIVLSYWYILGFAPHEKEETSAVMTKVLMPICSSCLITFLFLLEVSYDKLAFKAVKCLRVLESELKVSFFGIYERKHWHFSILYFVASMMFTTISIYSLTDLYKTLTLFQVMLLCLASIIPLISLFLVWMLLNYLYYKIIWDLPVSNRGAFLISIGKFSKVKDLEKYRKRDG